MHIPQGVSMSDLQSTRSTPNCSTCQYHCLGKFDNRTIEAKRDFELLGSAYALSAGIHLESESAGDDRIFVICSGQVKIVSEMQERGILNLQPETRGAVKDLNTDKSARHTNLTKVTAQTAGPIFGKVVRRAEFLGFMRRYGQIGLNGVGTLMETRLCFLVCSSPDFARICTWSPSKFCSCFKTSEAA